MVGPKFPIDKNPDKSPSAVQQLKTLLDGLLEDQSGPENNSLPKEQRAALEQLRRELAESKVAEARANRVLGHLATNQTELEATDTKKRKLPSSQQKWKNLCAAMAEDALKDNPPEISKAEVERVRENFKEAVADSYVARMEKSLAKKKHPMNKYIN